MKLTKKMCRVIADLECLIGSECYNPNSYDGWSGEEGRWFRYPVSFPDKDDGFVKIYGNLNETYLINQIDISKESILDMKYKFGTNELYIGSGLVEVIEYLEKRYDLDFWELEKNLKNK